jgi:hypothetical protein
MSVDLPEEVKAEEGEEGEGDELENDTGEEDFDADVVGRGISVGGHASTDGLRERRDDSRSAWKLSVERASV